MRNLAEANAVRVARSAIKRRIYTGELSVIDAMAEPCVASMLLSQLLDAQYRWGPVRARELLLQLGYRGVIISPYRRVCELTERQRAALAVELPAACGSTKP
jgi:hypothetical protein